MLAPFEKALRRRLWLILAAGAAINCVLLSLFTGDFAFYPYLSLRSFLRGIILQFLLLSPVLIVFVEFSLRMNRSAVVLRLLSILSSILVAGPVIGYSIESSFSNGYWKGSNSGLHASIAAGTVAVFLYIYRNRTEKRSEFQLQVMPSAAPTEIIFEVLSKLPYFFKDAVLVSFALFGSTVVFSVIGVRFASLLWGTLNSVHVLGSILERALTSFLISKLVFTSKWILTLALSVNSFRSALICFNILFLVPTMIYVYESLCMAIFYHPIKFYRLNIVDQSAVAVSASDDEKSSKEPPLSFLAQAMSVGVPLVASGSRNRLTATGTWKSAAWMDILKSQLDLNDAMLKATKPTPSGFPIVPSLSFPGGLSADLNSNGEGAPAISISVRRWTLSDIPRDVIVQLMRELAFQDFVRCSRQLNSLSVIGALKSQQSKSIYAVSYAASDCNLLDATEWRAASTAACAAIDTVSLQVFSTYWKAKAYSYNFSNLLFVSFSWLQRTLRTAYPSRA